MAINCNTTCYVDGSYYESGKEYDIDLAVGHSHRQYFDFPEVVAAKPEKGKAKPEKGKRPQTLASLTEAPGSNSPKTLFDATPRAPEGY